MKTELKSKEYVTFARKFVKETVDIMDIEELKSIVICWKVKTMKIILEKKLVYL